MVRALAIIQSIVVWSSLHQNHVHAFSPRSPLPKRQIGPLSATQLEPAAEEEKSTLTFNADCSLVSDAVPKDRKDDFIEYCRQDYFLTTLISSGGEREVHDVPRHEDLMSYWEEQCEEWCPEMRPQEDDTLVSTDTKIQFPGLTLTTTSCSAVKRGIDGSGLPEYKLLLIGEKQTVKGLAPVVWVFNKLTANDKKQKDKMHPTNGRVKTVISIAEEDDSYALSYDVKFQINIVFPKLLLKILPTTKEKAEAQGSATCLKTVSKEFDKAVEYTLEAFEKWCP